MADMSVHILVKEKKISNNGQQMDKLEKTSQRQSTENLAFNREKIQNENGIWRSN